MNRHRPSTTVQSFSKSLPKLFCILVLLALPLVHTAAQDILIPEDNLGDPNVITRVLGDQFINISLGFHIPLFIENPLAASIAEAYLPSNLNLGGSIALAWGVFLTNGFSLGLDLAGAFNTDINMRSFFTVPITFHFNYFFRFFPFELPLHFGIGVNFLGYNNTTAVGMILKSGFSFYWNAFEDWSFGLNILYWWLPEFHYDDGMAAPSNRTRYGNFLEVTISAMYNF